MRKIGPAIAIVFDPLVANRVASGVSTSRRLGFCGPMSRPRTVPIAKKRPTPIGNGPYLRATLRFRSRFSRAIQVLAAFKPHSSGLAVRFRSPPDLSTFRRSIFARSPAFPRRNAGEIFVNHNRSKFIFSALMPTK